MRSSTAKSWSCASSPWSCSSTRRAWHIDSFFDFKKSTLNHMSQTLEERCMNLHPRHKHTHLSRRKICLELQLLMAEFGQKHRQLLSSSSNPLQLSPASLGHSQWQESQFSSSNPLHLSCVLSVQSHWHVAELKVWKFLQLLAELAGHNSGKWLGLAAVEWGIECWGKDLVVVAA